MKKKVLLGMSGGVDSSVAAILLQEQGYEVIGLTMNLFKEKKQSTKNSNVDDIKKICEKLQIDHYFIDLEEEFQKRVICKFIQEYSNCRTPNPCIECNRFLKFGIMHQKALELGIDYIATGHYARIEYDKDLKEHFLIKSNSIKKDQSYVLYSIPKEILAKIIFPLGKFETKDEIRKIAAKNGLESANKPDSEDICFIPEGDYKRFLENNSEITPNSGDIVTTEGKVLGKHNGLYNYTIGQRKGLGISYSKPLFVIGFNKSKNQVIVGEEEKLYKKEIIVDDINWLINNPKDILGKEINTKIRYASKEAVSILEKIEGNKIKVTFKEPQRAPTEGQSAVFYCENKVLGGGKISKVL